ncbi:MAG TPA: hypothetical protein VK973_12610 [Arenicellales bacterium]|nr:hypothetical protein [Arenicellales bacterium]
MVKPRMPAISRRTRNWVLALILVPAAAWGVAKLAIWYSVKTDLDNLRDSLLPVAELEYSRILSPVFGAFGATGLRIAPHGVDGEIKIGSVMVHIQDPIDKYRFLSARLNDTVPTSFNVSVNGLEVPLSGDVANWINTTAGAPAAASAPSAACAAGTGLSVADLREMGYQELLADVRLDYSYDRRGGGLGTYLNLELKDMFAMTVEGRIPPSDVVFDLERMSGVPRLSDLTVTLNDRSWTSRFNSYCAGVMGLSVAEYVEGRVETTRQAFRTAGFEPSAELLDGLKRFAEGTASMTLNLNPREPLDPMRLDIAGDPEYLIDMLGLEVTFEGQPVSKLGTAIAVQTDEPETEAARVDETYKPTALDALPQYLKSPVQIYTADGKVHEGYLDSVDAGTIVLTRHLAGGSATFDVARANVEKVLVLRP